jgi:ribosomal protein S8
VQKKVSKKERRKNAENKSVEKVKKSVGKKVVRADCWYAQEFEPSYQFV